jgi:Fe-Mn family superoxide dismutase
MTTLSRRHFLSLSSVAALSAVVPSVLAKPSTPNTASKSGLITGQIKPLRHASIPGFLSAEQIAPHYTAHYGGALRGYLAADEILQSNIVAGTSIGAAYGSAQRARASKGNSILLHELYFDGMSLKKMTPSASLRAAIEKRFGSMEKWAEDFKASATSASGWAVLAVHTLNGKLYNVVCDQHATGLPWMSTPLITLDVYEHAYYVDYKNNKAEYIEKFMEHIDWDVIAKRYAL